MTYDQCGPPMLLAAVAAIVAIAAERARQEGKLGLLRDAIASALDPGSGPASDAR
jgi:hypothetical protein